MKILYKTKDFVIINKPIGMPSQPDRNGGVDAMTACAEELKRLGEGSTLFPINRLDQVVGGVMIFARNKDSAATLSEYAQNGEMSKEYFAVVDGDPGEGGMKDYLYKDSILGKAYVLQEMKNGAKEATLDYSTVATAEVGAKTYSLVRVRLHTGRFHQIRAQFSSRKFPLLGDKKYGSRDFFAKTPALHAFRLCFKFKSQEVAIRSLPDVKNYPWSLFAEENYR